MAVKMDSVVWMAPSEVVKWTTFVVCTRMNLCEECSFDQTVQTVQTVPPRDSV